MKEYIATLQPTIEGSHVAATLLLEHFDKLDEDDRNKLIEIIVTAEDGPWRSSILLNMAKDAGLIGKLEWLSWPQLKRLTDAMKRATEANKPDWMKALEAAFPPK